jgi:hypothetical protein
LGLAQLRALGKSKDAISLSFHKEMAKEREPRGVIPLGTPQDLLLSLSAARVEQMAGDMEGKYIFFSFFAMQSGTEREIQEGTSWHVFLVTSLTCVKEVTSKSRTAQRALKARSMSVKSSSRLKSSHKK